MAQRNTLLSKADYAARIGVHRSVVTRYCQRGMPEHKGMIDPDEADWWREKNLDQSKPKAKVSPQQQRKAAIDKAAKEIEAPRRKPAAGKPPAPPTPPPPAPDLDALSGTPDMNKARAWDIHFSAENRKRAMLKHDREHITRAEVEVVWDAANTMYRQGLEGVAGRTASIIATLTGGDAARIEGIIRDEHRTALAAVAELFERAAIFGENSGALPPGGGGDPPADEDMDG